MKVMIQNRPSSDHEWSRPRPVHITPASPLFDMLAQTEVDGVRNEYVIVQRTDGSEMRWRLPLR